MSTLSVAIDPRSRKVRLALVAWLAVALVVAVSEVIGRHVIRLPAIVPALVIGITTLALLVHRRSEAFRHFTATADLRPAILFHLVRVGYGAAFLALGAAGELHPTFAWNAGIGDVVAGALALPAAWLAGRGSRRLVFAWNALAFFDILLALGTAQRLIWIDGERTLFAPMQDFPFTLLPVLVLPWILLGHLWIFARLRRPAALTGAPAGTR